MGKTTSAQPATNKSGKKGKKPDLINELNESPIVVQESKKEEPITRTEQGKFPGTKLAALRQSKGSIKLTQLRPEPKKPFIYQIEHETPSGDRTQINSITGSYENAKVASRNAAINLQCAFDVKIDYTRVQ